MVTTKVARTPFPWDQPWAPDPDDYARDLGMTVNVTVITRSGTPALEVSPDRATRRSTAASAAAAIFEATGTTVDPAARPEPSEPVYSTPLDAYDPEPVGPDISEAFHRAARERERRNERDRARRLKAYHQRVRSGAPTHGPTPRGR